MVDCIRTAKSMMLGIVLLSIISCSASTPDRPIVIDGVVRENNPPKLEEFFPDDLENRNAPQPTLTISGKLRDESGVVLVKITDESGRVVGRENPVAASDGIYPFSIQVPLVPGKNKLELTAEDSYGNVFQKKIIYSNGEVPEIILIPEKTTLPLGGKTFVEIFLLNKGKRVPIPPDDVQLSADRGYFQGIEYHAPRTRGTVVLKVFHPGKKSTGQAKLQVIIPKITGQCNGPGEFFRGQQIDYAIDIQNVGEVVASQNYLVVKIPEGLIFKKANKNGKYRKIEREVSWKIDSIGAGDSEKVKLSLYAEKLGERKLAVSLHTGNEEVWKITTPLKVAGECDLKQQANPTDIRMGEKTIVQIAVIAQQKVSKVLCEYQFPDQLIFVSAKMKFNGETFRCKYEKNEIFTREVNKLEPGQRIEIEIELQAKRTGKFQNTLTVSFRGHGEKHTLKNTITVNAY